MASQGCYLRGREQKKKKKNRKCYQLADGNRSQSTRGLGNLLVLLEGQGIKGRQAIVEKTDEAFTSLLALLEPKQFLPSSFRSSSEHLQRKG